MSSVVPRRMPNILFRSSSPSGVPERMTLGSNGEPRLLRGGSGRVTRRSSPRRRGAASTPSSPRQARDRDGSTRSPGTDRRHRDGGRRRPSRRRASGRTASVRSSKPPRSDARSPDNLGTSSPLHPDRRGSPGTPADRRQLQLVDRAACDFVVAADDASLSDPHRSGFGHDQPGVLVRPARVDDHHDDPRRLRRPGGRTAAGTQRLRTHAPRSRGRGDRAARPARRRRRARSVRDGRSLARRHPQRPVHTDLPRRGARPGRRGLPSAARSGPGRRR